MSERLFVIGDVHGKYGMLCDLLKSWDGQSQLLFLGDLIDRGEDSRAVVALVKTLVEDKGAICLFGNHERMFLDYLYDPEHCYDHYRLNGGDTTINSFLGRPLDAPVDSVLDAGRICVEEADLVDFLTHLRFTYETEHYIFVHAGVDLSLEDWRHTPNYRKVWLRKPFHEGENKTGKTIVFGHTPVYYFYDEKPGRTNLWQAADGKIGMDGGAVYGGVLHGVLFAETGIVTDTVIENDGFIAAD